MEIDAVSEWEFNELKLKFEALLIHLNLDYYHCHHSSLDQQEKRNKYKCKDCKGSEYIFSKKEE